jgi:hypothetical protein
MTRALVEALRVARGGRRSDVKALCDAIHRDGARLSLPVARVEPLEAHVLVNHAGRRFAPLFSSREALAAAAARAGWTAPSIMELPAASALEVARARRRPRSDRSVR